MHTSIIEAPAGRRRRRHSEEFKASVIRACEQPGVSMAGIALANGLNATMLRKWVTQARAAQLPAAITSLIQSVKLNGHDPYEYLKDVLQRLPTQRDRDIAELLPHRWSAAG